MERNQLNSPKVFLHKGQGKDNQYASQLQVVREYFKVKTASRYMVAIETQVPIQNVCRYVDMLKSNNSIALVRKDYCRISGELVEFLSTNPELFPKDSQLKIWEA